MKMADFIIKRTLMDRLFGKVKYTWNNGEYYGKVPSNDRKFEGTFKCKEFESRGIFYKENNELLFSEGEIIYSNGDRAEGIFTKNNNIYELERGTYFYKNGQIAKYYAKGCCVITIDGKKIFSSDNGNVIHSDNLFQMTSENTVLQYDRLNKKMIIKGENLNISYQVKDGNTYINENLIV